MYSCFLNRESTGVHGMVEKMMEYALFMQRCAERLSSRLQNEQADGDQIRSGSSRQPSSGGSSSSSSSAGRNDANRLTASELKEFTALRSAFSKHANALLTLMSQLAQATVTPSSLLTLRMQSMNFNRYYAYH